MNYNRYYVYGRKEAFKGIWKKTSDLPFIYDVYILIYILTRKELAAQLQ